jgi:hypothetical protein
VQHEAVAVFAGQRVDDLLVAVGAERGNSQRLGFATGEQAEPWVRGSTPERMVIGRTVRVSRPSIRGSPLRMRPRTMPASISKNRLPTYWHPAHHLRRCTGRRRLRRGSP